MKTFELELDHANASGLEVELPGPPLVVAWGAHGFVMCGYLNIDAAEKLGVAAAIVRGVSTVDDLLAGKVQNVSRAAAARGVTEGMTGREALTRLA